MQGIDTGTIKVSKPAPSISADLTGGVLRSQEWLHIRYSSGVAFPDR